MPWSITSQSLSKTYVEDNFHLKCDLSRLEISCAGNKTEDPRPRLFFPFRLCRCLTNDRVQPRPHTPQHSCGIMLQQHCPHTTLNCRPTMWWSFSHRRPASVYSGERFPYFIHSDINCASEGKHMHMCRYKMQPFTFSMSTHKLLLYREIVCFQRTQVWVD